MKNLCLRLIKCENETSVINALDKYSLWDNFDNWVDYGNIESNYSVIGGQQATSDRALVEKITNSIDALLMLKCLQKGIIPSSNQAPRSLKDGLEKFYNFRNGSFSELLTRQKKDLAKDIVITTNGSTRTPSIAIIDKGEGQTPRDFPNTFLSLLRGNKIKIKFVQGSYNQGSTGTIKFCGKENLQLIISKRMPDIADPTDTTSDYWGFTIIRKFPATEETKNIVYRYLVINGEIPKFKRNYLNVLPTNKSREAYVNKLYYGSYVKLYDYQLPPQIRASSYKLLRNRLNLLIPDIALPISVYERRIKYEGQEVNYPGHVYGLNIIMEEIKEKLEPTFPNSFDIIIENSKIRCTIYAFKDVNDKKYYSDKSIIYTLMGQSHGFAGNEFLERKSIGKSLISKQVVIIVDCDNLTSDQKSQLFMSNRDRLFDSDFKKELVKKLEKKLKENQALKDFQIKKKREITSKVEEDKTVLKNTLNDLIRNSMFHQVLTKGKVVHSPVDLRSAITTEIFKAVDPPTRFKLAKPIPFEKPRMVGIGRKGRFEFDTDAKNQYFTRIHLPGKMSIYYHLIGDENGKVFQLKEHEFEVDLFQGNATILLNIPDQHNVYDILKFTVEVMDDTRIKPMGDQFYLKLDYRDLVLPGLGSTNPKKPKKPGLGDKKTGEKYDLPEIIPVHQKDWKSYEPNFTRETCGFAQKNDEDGGYFVFLNYDNVFLRGELSQMKEGDRELYRHFYETTVVLICLGIIQEQMKLEKQELIVDVTSIEDYYIENEHIQSLEAKTRWTTDAICPIIIPLIKQINKEIQKVNE